MVRLIALIAALVTAAPVYAETLKGEPDLLAVDVNRGYVFAVGNNGEIWSKKIRKGEWQTYRKTTHSALLSVSVVSGRDVWVVGVGGMFIHFDGEDWISPGGQHDENFRAVAFKARRKGIAVGDEHVSHYVRNSWGDFQALTRTPKFHAVARIGRGRYERFVGVGEEGAAVAFRGVGASLAADLELTGTKQNLVAIDGCRASKSQAVAVGTGAMLRAADGTWTKLPDPPEALSSVVVQCKRGKVTRAFATGKTDLAIYDAAAGTWSSRAIEGATVLHALDWLDKKQLILVGDKGFVTVVPAASE